MIQGQAKRVCRHEGEAINADLKAVVYGQSKVNREGGANGLPQCSETGSLPR